MKTIHVVAVVIEAVDEQGKENIFSLPKEGTEIWKAAGNSPVEN